MLSLYMCISTPIWLMIHLTFHGATSGLCSEVVIPIVRGVVWSRSEWPLAELEVGPGDSSLCPTRIHTHIHLEIM